MVKPIFDLEDGDFIFSTSGNLGFDSDGNMMMRISDNMSMDMDSGELHFVSSWEDDEEENQGLVTKPLIADYLRD